MTQLRQIGRISLAQACGDGTLVATQMGRRGWLIPFGLRDLPRQLYVPIRFHVLNDIQRRRTTTYVGGLHYPFPSRTTRLMNGDDIHSSEWNWFSYRTFA